MNDLVATESFEQLTGFGPIEFNKQKMLILNMSPVLWFEDQDLILIILTKRLHQIVIQN